MTAEATPTRSARKPAPPRVPCPQAGCGYTMDSAGSIPAHLAMAHPEVPMDRVAPRRGTTDPMSQPLIDGAASSGQTARDAGPSESGMPAAAIAPSSPAQAMRRVLVALEQIRAADNVRLELGDLEGLAASIRDIGLQTPPVLAPDPERKGDFVVVTGHRRVEACRLIDGLYEIPAWVTYEADLAARSAHRTAAQLDENTQREPLNAIEEATALRVLLDAEPGLTQATLALRRGKSAPWVANRLRLLSLAGTVQAALRTGALSAAHGVAIASLPAKQQREMAAAVVDEKLSAHALEQRLKWKTAEAQNDEARAKRTEKRTPKLVAALEAAAVPKDVAVYLSTNTYDVDEAPLRKAIAAAGWKLHTDHYAQERPAKGECDCKVVRATFDRAWKVVPGCIDGRHQDRQRNLERVLSDAERKADQARAAVLREAFERELRAAALSAPFLRVLHRATASYYYSKPDGGDPVAAIAELLTNTARQRENLAELMAELGLAEPAAIELPGPTEASA